MTSLLRTSIAIPLVRLLKKTKHPTLLAIAASLAATIRTRSLVYIIHRDRFWEHWQKGQCVVNNSPALSFVPSTCDRMTMDHWPAATGLQHGDVVIDIGACNGDNTLHFSNLVGRTGKVIAVEAHPETFRCLQRTCQLNALENVIPVNAAANKTGETVTISDGDHNLANSIGPNREGYQVPGVTLDQLVHRYSLDRVDYLKMNIEGAEVLALEGMKATLSKVRTIAISCHDFLADRGGDERCRTFVAVKSLLERQGFSLSFRIDDQRDFIRYQINGINTLLSNNNYTRVAG